ncbi:PREDICTED: UDP-glucuronosyltransferase 2B7-like, partial [Priapulus caudatus]|uniref:UDP-glucuronosyltransferase 2B7-like n=1 Tax=Priapulus caudatus TaxID=37621 RepID=A0ABM1EZG2_PRICU
MCCNLPQGVEPYIAGAGERPVIFVSFGTFVSSMEFLPKEVLHVILETFGSLSDYFFVWTINRGGVDPIIPTNVRVFNRVPQNDILGHPRTVAFVTHGGKNGLWEAIYHAVPMVAMPLAADQYRNVAAMTNRGFGLRVDF